MTRRGALPVLLLAGLLLAGCLEQPNGQGESDGRPFIYGTMCPPMPSGISCAQVDGQVVLEGTGTSPVDLERLLIWPGSDIVVRSLHLRGLAEGFHIEVDSHCRCTFSFENVTFEGAGGAAALTIRLASLSGGDPDFTAALENVVVSGFDIGINMSFVTRLEAHNVEIDCHNTGWMMIPGDSVSISHLDVRGCRQIALDMVQSTAALLVDSIFLDSGAGVRIGGPPLEGDGPFLVRNVTASRNGVGIFAHATEIDVRGSVFHQNGMPGEWLEELGHTGAGIWAPLAGGTVRDSSFEGNQGVAIDSAGVVTEAPDNWWGSPYGPSLYPVRGTPANPVQGDAVTVGVMYLPFRETPP